MSDQNEYTRAQYLKALYNARNQSRSTSNPLVNPSNMVGNAGADISALATLDTTFSGNLDSVAPKNDVSVSTPTDERNWWQKTWDTITEFSNNIAEGAIGVFDGIGDAIMYGMGSVGSWFGADNQWARDAMNYDWQSQFMQYWNQQNVMGNLMSGDIFTDDYWQGWTDLGSAEASRDRINRAHANSYTANLGEGGQQFYNEMTQAVGNVLPTIAMGIATGGSSVAVQMAASAVPMAISAGGHATTEALNDGAEWGEAGASGLVAAAIEGGTELVSAGLAKGTSKIASRFAKEGVKATSTITTHVAGATIGEKVSKITLKELGKTAIEEGTEELVSELLRPFVKATYKGTEAFEEYKDPELYVDALKSFAGGAVGGVFGSIANTTYMTETYGKEGVAAKNDLVDITNLKEQARNEAKKGEKANQELIDSLELEIGQKIQSFAEHVKKLQADTKHNGAEKAQNLLELLGNPKATLDQITTSLDKNTYDSLADHISDSLNSKGVNNNIQILNEEAFDKIVADLSNGATQGNENRAFIVDDKQVYVNQKYQNQIYKLVAHETISHALLDTNKESRNSIINLIENDSEMSKEFHKLDSSLSEEYKNGNESPSEETMTSERLARFLENVVYDETTFNKVMGSENKSLRRRMRTIFQRAINKLNPKSDKLLIKTLNNVIEEIGKENIAAKNNQNNEVQENQNESKTVKVKFARTTNKPTNNTNTQASQTSNKTTPKLRKTIQASKDYANSMQARVINSSDVTDVHKLVQQSLVDTFGYEVKIDKNTFVKNTTIDFNTLNKKTTRDKFFENIRQTVDALYDNKIIESTKNADGKVSKVVLDRTLNDVLRDMNFTSSEIQDFKIDTVKYFVESLRNKSDATRIARLARQYQIKLNKVKAALETTRANSRIAIKALKEIQTIIKRIEQNRLNNTKPGNYYIGELEFYKNLLKNVRVSQRGFSTTSIEHIINNFNGYTEENLQQYKWLKFNPLIAERVDFLRSLEVDGKFPTKLIRNIDVVQAVSEIISAVRLDMKDLTTATGIARRQAVQKAEVETEIVALDAKSKTTNGAKRAVGVIQRELDNASSPDIFFMRYFGDNSDAYRIIYTDVYDAYNEQLLKKYEFKNALDNVLNENNIKESQLEKAVDFKGYKVTINDLLDIYAHAQTTNGLDTLKDGGYKFSDVYKKLHHMTLTDKDIDNIRSILGDNNIDFTDKVLSNLYNGDLKQFKIQADNKNIGFTNVLSDTEVYYPSNKSETKAFSTTESVNDYKTLDVSNVSMNKERHNVTNKPLKGMGFTSRYYAYIDAITKYDAMYQPLRTLETYLNGYMEVENDNGKTRKVPRFELLNESIPEFDRVMRYYKDQILGNPTDTSRTGNSKLWNNLVASSLFGNASVVLKQLASIPTIMNEVGLGNFIKSMPQVINNLTHYRTTKEFIQSRSGILSERWNTMDATASRLLAKHLSKLSKALGVPIEKMDEAVIVTFGFASAQLEAEAAGNGKIGSATNNEAAIKILNRIVTNTQSNSIPIKMSMNRAGANGSMRKTLSVYSSDLQNKVNYVNSAFNNRRYARSRMKTIDSEIAKIDEKIANGNTSPDLVLKKENLTKIKKETQLFIDGSGEKKALKLLLSLFLNGLIVSGINEFIQRLYGRKGWDENTLDTFAQNLLIESTINNLPYVSQILNALDYNQQLGNYQFQQLNNIIELVSKIKNGDSLNSILFQLGTTLGDLLGLPLKNVYNLIMGIYKNVDPSGYKVDAIVRGYSSNYLYTQYQNAVESGSKSLSTKYLTLVMGSYKTGSTDTEVINELNSLYQSGYNALPTNMMTSYTDSTGKVVTLSEKQKAEFKRFYSQSTEDAKALLHVTDYRKATQEEQAKYIKKIYDAYNEYAKMKITKQTTGTSRIAQLLASTNGKINLSKYIIANAKIAEITETKNKSRKELVIEYVNRLAGMTKQEKLILLALNGYSISDTNKKQVSTYLMRYGANASNSSTIFA